MLICMQKINFITLFFLKVLQRKRKLVILRHLGMPGDTYLKMIVSIWKNLSILSVGKNFSSFTYSSRYGKDIANLLFWVL